MATRTLSRRMMMILTATAVGPLLIALSTKTNWNASAQSTAPGADPVPSSVNALYAALLDTMKRAKQMTVKARYEKLEPVVKATFDSATMAKVAVGDTWTAMTPAQQSAIVTEFARMTVANYAKQFDDFNGEKFEVGSASDQGQGDKLVKTRIIQGNGKPVALNYLMRQSAGGWKVIDVYLDGTISELASRRSEFGSVLKSGGPDGLISALRVQTDKLLAGA